MAKIKIDNYIFDADALTITFSDYIAIDLNKILLITNVFGGTNTIIYNFADATKGGYISDNVLYLLYDTSLMNDSDPLIIYYDESYRYVTLDNVSTTYNDSVTTASSTAVDCCNYRQATLGFALQYSNAPTNIVFEIWVSLDGTNYFKQMNDFLGDLRYSPLSIGVADTDMFEAVTFPIACKNIYVKVNATGTDGRNCFTVTNAALYLRT